MTARERSAVDPALVARAKAGDAAAVADVIRITTPEIRRIARRAIAARGASMSMLDDAVAEGMIVAWKAIHDWNPRVSLATFAVKAIRGAAHEVVSADGYAISIGEKYTPRKAKTAEALAAAKSIPVSIDDPDDSGRTLADTLPSPTMDPSARHDAATILARAAERPAEILWRVACGDEYPDIAADHGHTKQHVGAQYLRAVESLRRVFNPRKAA